MTPKRIFGKVINIDYKNTIKFFNARAAKVSEVGPLSVTMYQDKHPELAQARDIHEKNVVLPLLTLTPETKVLDIGCGTGRWARHLENNVASYLGIDFSEELIKIAIETSEKENRKNTHFQVLSAIDFENRLFVPPPFGLIIIAGLFVYLNDDDCMKLLAKLPQLCAPQANIYIREPVGIQERLTLDNFYSADLEADYNAIYRPESQYMEWFKQFIIPSGFSVAVCQDLFPPDLNNRQETKQKVFILHKGKS